MNQQIFNPRDFGKRLKIARNNSALAREDVALKLGVHKNTFGNYERGERLPDVSFVTHFCNFLVINPSWLLTGKGSMNLNAVATGLNTKLLEQIVEQVELFLGNKLALSADKKAKVVTILYEKAIKNEKWRIEVGLEETDQQFVLLLAEDIKEYGHGNKK